MITLSAIEVWGTLAISLVIGILGNGIVTTILKHKWEKEEKKADNKSEWQTKIEKSCEELQEVCDCLLYHTLADKLEYYRVRGWADDTDRREILSLHSAYKKRGFNGDMDSRMEAFFKLPMEEPSTDNGMNDFFAK